jgi:hypothetical protein
VLPLDDPKALLAAARGGGFWAYVAGTAHYMITSEPYAAAIASQPHGVALVGRCRLTL